MVLYKIVFAKRVRKDFRKIPERDATRLLSAIKLLAADPLPSHSKKLKGEELFRIRIGNYRVIYSIEDDRMIVSVVKVGHRKNVYQS
ncbi:MAG: mRNA interferase RelE/StbE [Lentimonas sp.]|jgi:mRNA interferase RelE/StbE